MTDREQGTRRLDSEDNEPISPNDDSQETADYAAPWVIELRVVGTPSVLQVRVGNELVIGRSDPRDNTSPDIDLEPYEGYQQGVSRRHAVFFPKNNRLMLRDLGSSNGSYINGRFLLKGQEYRVRHGDTVTIGKLNLQVFFAVMPSSTSDQADKTHPNRFEIKTVGHGQHILVVDHDAAVAQVFGSVLEQAGFHVTIVGSFTEAVGIIDQKMPDAVMLELMLPDMSGLELVKYIREKEDGKFTPLLVCTSATGGFQMGQAVEAGVDVFMFKPVGVDELMRGIAKVADQMHS